MIDPTITIGNIIEVGAFIFGGLVLVLKRNTAIDYMAKELSQVQTEIKDLTKSITTLAISEVKIKNVEQDIREIRSDLRDLKHGKGFVKESIDKEWGTS